MTFVFFASPRLRVTSLSARLRAVSQVTELLFLCDALEAKLTQAESASTQLLAAVHHLLQEYSREDAKGKALGFLYEKWNCIPQRRTTIHSAFSSKLRDFA